MSNHHRDGNGWRLALRARVVNAVIVGFAAGAMCLQASAASVGRSGTIIAKFTVNFGTAPPSGSTVSCSVSLIGDDVLAPSDSGFNSANVSGSSAVCNVTMRYKWLVADAASHMTIAYSVSGPSQNSSGISQIITIPASLTTTHVNVTITQ